MQFTQVWVNVTESLTQEEAVMEAISTRGPMTVSVNAEPEDWRFYKSGVYVNKACSPKLKKLDHAVIVSGWVFALNMNKNDDLEHARMISR